MNYFDSLKAMFQGQYDPNAMNEMYGVPQGVVDQARSGQLMQMGLGMIAAGQQLTPAQRAQVMQQIGSGAGDFQSSIYNAAQSRLMSDRIKEARAAKEQQQAGMVQLTDMINQMPDGREKAMAQRAMQIGEFDAAKKIVLGTGGAGGRWMTPEEKQQVGFGPQDPIWIDENGEPKLVGGRGMTVNNNMGGSASNEDDLRKEMMKQTGDTWAKYEAAGNTAANMRSNMVILDELMQFAPQGPIQGRLAEAFPGFSSAGSAFNSIVRNLAPQMRVEGSGSTSDIEYQGFLDSLPSLRNNPDANRLISEVLKSRADVLVKRSQIVSAYKTGDIDFRRASQMLDELNKQSIVPDQLRRMIGGLGTGGEIDDLMSRVPGQ